MGRGYKTFLYVFLPPFLEKSLQMPSKSFHAFFKYYLPSGYMYLEENICLQNKCQSLGRKIGPVIPK